MGIATRYGRLAGEIAQACREAGRDSSEVAFIAVSKTVGSDEVAEAIEAGACDFGENRPDGLVAKQQAHPAVRWHFIGNIQARRIGDIVKHADLIHSLHEERHADRIDAAAKAAGKVQDVLLEVNVSGETSKSGRTPEDVAALLDHCLTLDNVRVCGLMTMAPQGDRELARDCFDRLREVRDKLLADHATHVDDRFMRDLSMGMTEDWREGIAAGATMVRIGRAVFDDAFE